MVYGGGGSARGGAGEGSALRGCAEGADAGNEVDKFAVGSPAGGLGEAAIGGEGEAVRRGVLEAEADTAGDFFGGLNEIVLDVDDADGGVFAGVDDLADDVEFGELAIGHFDVDFVDVELEEVGK